MPSWLSWIPVFAKWTDTEVLNLIVEIKKGIAVLESDVAKANAWVVANAGTISADIVATVSLVQTIGGAGVAIPAAVLTAAAEANTANTALQAYLAAQLAGQTTVNALVAGYVAAKTASEAHSSMQLAVAKMPAAQAS